MAKRSIRTPPKKPERKVIAWLRKANWILQTPAAEKAKPIKAATAFNRFHSAGKTKSISRMPTANSASSTIGSDSR